MNKQKEDRSEDYKKMFLHKKKYNLFFERFVGIKLGEYVFYCKCLSCNKNGRYVSASMFINQKQKQHPKECDVCSLKKRCDKSTATRKSKCCQSMSKRASKVSTT